MEGTDGLLIMVIHHHAHLVIVHPLQGVVVTQDPIMWCPDGRGMSRSLLLLPEAGLINPGPLKLTRRDAVVLQLIDHILLRRMDEHIWILIGREGGVLFLKKEYILPGLRIEIRILLENIETNHVHLHIHLRLNDTPDLLIRVQGPNQGLLDHLLYLLGEGFLLLQGTQTQRIHQIQLRKPIPVSLLKTGHRMENHHHQGGDDGVSVKCGLFCCYNLETIVDI